MQILRSQAIAQLSTTASPTRPKVTGQLNIGTRNTVVNFDKTTHMAYVRRAIVCDVAGWAEIAIDDAGCTGSAAYVAPTAQSRQVVATGTVTTAGTVFFRVTGSMYSSLPGGFKFITVNVPTGLPAVWGTTVREAVQANSDFTNLFTVTGSGDTIVMTRIVDEYGFANDATLEVQIFATGTAVGATTSASTNVATGALATGTYFEESDPVDAEGVDLPLMETATAGLLVECERGSGTCEDDAADLKFPIVTDGFALFANGGADTSIRATCAVPPLEVFISITTLIA